MSVREKESGEMTYQRKLSRRESLRWMGALAGGTAVTMALPACDGTEAPAGYAPWPELSLTPITAKGYGTDPDLISPAPASWPRIMSDGQLALAAVLADIIVPREGSVPSASEAGVVDVIDEWISAPYPTQQDHRAMIEPGLKWLDDEASRRFGSAFADLSDDQRIEMVEEVAFADRPTPPGLERPKAFFAGFRSLVVGAWVTTPEGMKDLGYEGNVAIAGDYPGPTPEAMAHLEGLIEELGLRLE